MCGFHCSELPFHFPLGSSPRPAAAAAPLLHWSRGELVPGLELLEERKRRRLEGERQSRALWVVSAAGRQACGQKTQRDGSGNGAEGERR